MSKSNDSKNLDRSESLPASGFSSLFHTNVTSVEMRGLQSSVRKQRELGEKNKIGDYDFETEDEDSSSKQKKQVLKQEFWKTETVEFLILRLRIIEVYVETKIKLRRRIVMKVCKILIRNKKIMNVWMLITKMKMRTFQMVVKVI